MSPVERRKSMHEVELELTEIRAELRWTRRAAVLLVLIAPFNVAQHILPYFR